LPNPLAWLSRDSQHLVFRALRARLLDEKIELGLIRRYVRPTDTVCDIGANKGSFVFWLSRWCRKGQVIAFEPQPTFANLLLRLTRSLGLDNVKVEQKAVFSRDGHADLFVPEGQLPSASLVAKVAGSGFDQAQRISLMKVDVEGAELEVFKGAERILREQSPLLIFECEGRHLQGASMADVFAYLNALGYSGSFVDGNRLLPVSQFDPAVHQKQDSEWFWKAKDYRNNFVFSKTPL
jgi:FkbM family methyltransferase